VVSARDKSDEKIQALDAGADDYVEKPFDLGELLARLRTAMRHGLARDGADPVLRSGKLEVDLLRRRVRVDGVAVTLTPREYSLLALLARNAGRVMTHGQLLAAIWGPAHSEDVQYLRVYVGQLRQKLGPAAGRLVGTEPGVGYRLSEMTDSG
jgi:two-component system KDP operon response regulator KdpE